MEATMHDLTTRQSAPTDVLSGFDLDNHDSSKNLVIRLNAALAAVIIVILSARLFARIRYLRRVFSDDGASKDPDIACIEISQTF
jgi:hypothetical protein